MSAKSQAGNVRRLSEPDSVSPLGPLIAFPVLAHEGAMFCEMKTERSFIMPDSATCQKWNLLHSKAPLTRRTGRVQCLDSTDLPNCRKPKTENRNPKTELSKTENRKPKTDYG